MNLINHLNYLLILKAKSKILYTKDKSFYSVAFFNLVYKKRRLWHSILFRIKEMSLSFGKLLAVIASLTNYSVFVFT